MIYGFAELKLSYLWSSSRSSRMAGRGRQRCQGCSRAARLGLRSLRAGLRVCLGLQRAAWTAEPGTRVPGGLGLWRSPGPSFGSQHLCPHLAPILGWAAPTPHSILQVLACARLGKRIPRWWWLSYYLDTNLKNPSLFSSVIPLLRKARPNINWRTQVLYDYHYRNKCHHI